MYDPSFHYPAELVFWVDHKSTKFVQKTGGRSEFNTMLNYDRPCGIMIYLMFLLMFCLIVFFAVCFLSLLSFSSLSALLHRCFS